MEYPRVTRRSASHGALHSAYSSHSRAQPSGTPSRPLRLRSVKENVGFLTSPGPLESMLKTTTETGDIGIFSIGTISTTRTVHRLPPRSRTGISESNRPWRTESGGSDRQPSQDDRRRLPSYRAATPEVLSMYGSDGPKSVYSSESRRFDNYSIRSYSMTSSNSRSYPLHPAHPPVPAYPNEELQRPRSPFPYPTRLKRPGVRPSSPALTDNGDIDYSRMVGIDRVSFVSVQPMI